jgi:hypothetical protein
MAARADIPTAETLSAHLSSQLNLRLSAVSRGAVLPWRNSARRNAVKGGWEQNRASGRL